MQAELYVGIPTLRKVELDDIERDRNDYLSYASFVGLQTIELVAIAFNSATRLYFEGKRYKLEIDPNGRFRATIEK